MIVKGSTTTLKSISIPDSTFEAFLDATGQYANEFIKFDVDFTNPQVVGRLIMAHFLKNPPVLEDLKELAIMGISHQNIRNFVRFSE